MIRDRSLRTRLGFGAVSLVAAAGAVFAGVDAATNPGISTQPTHGTEQGTLHTAPSQPRMFKVTPLHADVAELGDVAGRSEVGDAAVFYSNPHADELSSDTTVSAESTYLGGTSVSDGGRIPLDDIRPFLIDTRYGTQLRVSIGERDPLPELLWGGDMDAQQVTHIKGKLPVDGDAPVPAVVTLGGSGATATFQVQEVDPEGYDNQAVARAQAALDAVKAGSDTVWSGAYGLANERFGLLLEARTAILGVGELDPARRGLVAQFNGLADRMRSATIEDQSTGQRFPVIPGSFAETGMRIPS